MAMHMPTLLAPNLFYVASSILIGSTIVTYLLKFIKLDLKPFLSTKPGKALEVSLQTAFERFLNVLSVSDPLSPPTSPTTMSSRGYLESIPYRRGSRPEVEGISSPIQKTQLPPWEEKDVEDSLRNLIIDIPSRYPQSTYLGRSTFEPESPISLYARHRVFDETKYYGEILSANTEDGFIHSTLHPSDVKIVIEKGWGQRHPLSGRVGSRFMRLFSANQPSHVEGSQVLLYAPRDQDDLEVIQNIINAAVWWVGGIDNRVDAENF
ncbi:hypothetical protein AYO21_03294 [Fonsecaea monophora]|uniref:Luciferase domain-containing protein n=2 Tax=Fonsecaea TaxID=40354 RepID=A0A178BPV4_9EURO|nr:hypothetical protein AYO20_11602 [Fonsecaea nubica]XP_022514370.1 hypothetical protein AYO21_03294 [Fonsecaea monophora]KAH0842991.1 hypothetical protein FOPE_08286 [Fonsecaea pedrosoi]OAG42418.1 hypothetical protein AYO21_03294 [Fonsecaea monophora]OAL19698.1 hypothetical protein AYO20_11602 [Fonsecaea nubica]